MDQGCEDERRDGAVETNDKKGEDKKEDKGWTEKGFGDEDGLDHADDRNDQEIDRKGQGLTTTDDVPLAGTSTSTERADVVRSTSPPTEAAKGAWSHPLANTAEIVLDDSQV